MFSPNVLIRKFFRTRHFRGRMNAISGIGFRSDNALCSLPHSSHSDVEKLIIDHTEVSCDHLTPEIKLHLITEKCDQWRAREEEVVFSGPPFWAFYWPGGQALTRYLLDSGLCAGGRVLDVGCGCGASSIAAALTGAAYVVANDIDPVALRAVAMNARMNRANVQFNGQNLIGSDLHTSHHSCLDSSATTEVAEHDFRSESTEESFGNFDLILIGDMFYDAEITASIMNWLDQISDKSRILVGDPGRPYFDENVMARLDKIVEYALTDGCRRENNGLTSAGVYQYRT